MVDNPYGFIPFFLNPFIGDTGSGGQEGLVPPPPAGSAAAGYYLSADGTFSLPTSGNTINSVVLPLLITDKVLSINNATETTVGVVKITNTYPTIPSTTDATTSTYVQQAIADALISGRSFRGGYDASSNLFPSSGGSGSGGSIRGGDYWIITIGGTLGGTEVFPSDTVLALVDAPGQTAANWIINSANINFNTSQFVVVGNVVSLKTAGITLDLMAPGGNDGYILTSSSGTNAPLYRQLKPTLHQVNVTVNSTDITLSLDQNLSPSSAPTFTSIILTDLTAGYVMIIDGSQRTAVSTVTSTTLAYIQNVTSDVQAQLNGKQPTGAYITSLNSDVVASGPGAASATIQPGVVTYAKIQNTTQGSILIGRYAATAGSFEEILLGSGLALNTGTGVLSVTGAPPTGAASGDLSGSYPGPTVARINGAVLGTTTATAGNLLIASAGNAWTSVAMSGDITIGSTGVTAISSGVIINSDINASAGIVDTKLATISTAGKVLNSATTADSANTLSAIVARDASGNFAAGTITAALTGNASTATALQNARTIGGVSFDGTANIVPQTIQSVNEATDTTCFILFITDSGTQSLQPKNNIGLTYNSSTNAVGATTFTGALVGNASSATVLATPRGIYGNNFDGSAALTQVIASTYGGTNNAFFAVSGLTTSIKTKTFRDASDTVLELGGSYTPTGTWTSLKLVTPTLGTPVSGTLTNCTGLPTTALTGTLQATQFPALTGDVTTSAGSLATTIKTNVSLAGSPTTTTQAASDNSTNIATTAFVTTAINNALSMGATKAACKYATAAALPANTYNNGSSGVGATLTGNVAGALSVDGNAVAVNDSVLVLDEVTQSHNGIFTVSVAGSVSVAYVLTRRTDFNSSSTITTGDTVFVTNGSTLTNTTWQMITAGTITPGTSNIVFTQIAGPGTYTAGTGLTLTGSSFSITNTTVTASSYGSSTAIPTFTVNAQGQLTAANTVAVIAPAGTLTGTTLASNVVNSSLTGVGTLTVGVWNATAISLTTYASGTLQAAQFPALTGDVTTSAGSLATTVGKINGVALGSTTATAGNLLIASGTAWVSTAVTGNVTINSSGVTTIGALQITNGMIAASTIDLTAKVTGLLPLANGGTNANLTASNGGIFYSTASAAAILAGTATASKMLLSGSSTTPTWSTSTIPSSAGATAGKVLVSNGTNYVLSTPTFPNASAASGKIIISDGTNWIASTPTFSSTAGTAGNLLISSGTNWVTNAVSGDITINSTGVTAVGANVVTYAKFQQVGASSLIGNPTGLLANASEITIGATLAFVSSALQTVAMSGDITTPANSFVTALATVNANVGTFGDATHVGSFTVNAKGLITAASNIAISGVPPGGSAGGDLSGTYPNPTVAAINGTALGSTTATAGNLLIASGTAWISTAVTGNVTISSLGVTTIGALQITNGMIAASTIDLTAKVTGVLPNANTTAASANTLSAIVTRDASGNFSAGTITATLSGSASTLTTTRTIWGQNFNGSANVTGSLTAVTNITGGASSMTITAGTGNSRTMALQTTTSGGVATTALTLSATQSATFANTVNATTFVGTNITLSSLSNGYVPYSVSGALSQSIIFQGPGPVATGVGIGGTDIRGILTVQTSSAATFSANSDPTDSGRFFVMENTNTSNAANQFANITLQINPGGAIPGGRCLADIRLIRAALNSSTAYFLFSGFQNDGNYYDFAKIDYSSNYFVGSSYFGGSSSATAFIDIAASTASTASLHMAAGTLLTSPVSGSIEYDGSYFYETNSTPTRKIVLSVGLSSFTTGQLYYASSSTALSAITPNSSSSPQVLSMTSSSPSWVTPVDTYAYTFAGGL